MNFPALIVRNTFRNRVRTGLALCGMVVAVVAFIMLRTFLDGFHRNEAHARQDRLAVRDKVSFTMELPLAYREKIASVPGVTAVAWWQWFGGEWKDRNHFFAKFAVDPDSFFAVRPEIKIDRDALARWKADRQGVVIGDQLAEAFGFKVGDVIPVKGDIFPGNWQFRVDGIVSCDDPGVDTRWMLIQYDYLNESLSEARKDKCNIFWIRVANADQAPTVAATIDKMFENSPWATKTESEKAFALGFLSMLSAIMSAISLVSAVVLLIVMLVLANTIAMSVRERTREYAVMRCFGFKPRHLVALVFGEAAVTAAIGGGLGMLLSQPILAAAGKAMYKTGFVPRHPTPSPATLVAAAIGVVVIGGGAALVPAIRSARINIIEALRKIA